MTINTVPSSRGIDWIKAGIDTFQRNPGLFLGMGAVTALIAMVPIVNMVFLLVWPLLMGGLILAADRTARGETVEFGELFAAFQQEGKLVPMLLLCLPTIVVTVVLVVLLFLFGGAAVFAAIAAGGGEMSAGAAAGLIGTLGVFMVVGVLGGLFASACTFFAIPEVMLRGTDTFAAIQLSLRAAMANLGAFLLAVIGLGMAVFVVALVLSIFFGWVPILGFIVVQLGMLALAACVYPVFAFMQYQAWLDVVAGDANAPPALTA